jgi:hypothetical protein
VEKGEALQVNTTSLPQSGNSDLLRTIKEVRNSNEKEAEASVAGRTSPPPSKNSKKVREYPLVVTGGGGAGKSLLAIQVSEANIMSPAERQH